MNSETLSRLKIAVNQFYLNKYSDQPIMTDEEYDKLVEEYEAEGWSVKDLIEFEEEVKRTHKPLPKVSKDVIKDNDLNLAQWKYRRKNRQKVGDDYYLSYLNYKYDGSSIIAYYDKNGRLTRILGTPDQNICLDRTKNCWNMFPHRVTPGIERIQGEFLVDAGVYGEKARNKANGLLNSKDKIYELENEGFVRVYQMGFYDGNWSIQRLIDEMNKLNPIVRKRSRSFRNYNGSITPNAPTIDVVFSSAEHLSKAPKNAINEEASRDLGEGYCSDPVEFQVDGVVVYDTLGYHAFKFYYTESAVTTVRKVAWQPQSNGSWMPKLQYDKVTLNGKSYSQVASGGVPNLIEMKMGVGSKIRIIISGMTIPKVVEVLEPSEIYNFPKCSCGYQLTESDIFGSTVKCQSEHCDRRFNMWNKSLRSKLTKWCGTNWDEFIENPDSSIVVAEHTFQILDLVLNIDRWEARKQLKKGVDPDSIIARVWQLVLYDRPEYFYHLIDNNFKLTSLSRRMFNANKSVAFDILHKIFNKQ